MKKPNILNILKEKQIIIPLYIYKLFPKLKINMEAFMFLMYLYNCGEKIIFDPKKISEEFGITMEQLLSYIDQLSKNHLIDFEIIKNEKNISEEYLSLSYFYDKLSMLLIEETNEQNYTDDNYIFELIEKEFGRVLSPIEYEIIRAWHENNISDEFIKEALKEAVFNGVSNLRYIDKILYEWQKKGFKNLEDIEKSRKKFREQKEKIEIVEYNWLEDDE